MLSNSEREAIFGKACCKRYCIIIITIISIHLNISFSYKNITGSMSEMQQLEDDFVSGNWAPSFLREAPKKRKGKSINKQKQQQKGRKIKSQLAQKHLPEVHNVIFKIIMNTILYRKDFNGHHVETHPYNNYRQHIIHLTHIYSRHLPYTSIPIHCVL